MRAGDRGGLAGTGSWRRDQEHRFQAHLQTPVCPLTSCGGSPRGTVETGAIAQAPALVHVPQVQQRAGRPHGRPASSRCPMVAPDAMSVFPSDSARWPPPPPRAPWCHRRAAHPFAYRTIPTCLRCARRRAELSEGVDEARALLAVPGVPCVTQRVWGRYKISCRHGYVSWEQNH